MLDDVFSLPGFAPLDAPNEKDRVENDPDGFVRICFYKDRPVAEPSPQFQIYMGKEFGNQVDLYAMFGNDKVTCEVREFDNAKDYWFTLFPQEISVMPGNYTLRFFANQKLITVKQLSLTNSLAQSQFFPPSFQA